MRHRGEIAMAVSAAIGVWLYVAPGVLGYDGAQADSDRICGALAISFSFVAIWEFMRGLRLVNRPIAVWMAISVALFTPPVEAVVSTLACAVALLALSFVRGEIERPYGGGWRVVIGRGER